MQFFKYLSVYFYDFFNAKAEKAKANSQKSLNSYEKKLTFFYSSLLERISWPNCARHYVSGQPAIAFLPALQKSSGMEAALYLCISVQVSFSPEKLTRKKCHGRHFLRTFRGSASAPLLHSLSYPQKPPFTSIPRAKIRLEFRNGFAAPPIPARSLGDGD